MCDDIMQETLPIKEKQEVQVSFDFNGGRLENDLTLQQYPIAKKIKITQYLSYNSSGYEVSLSDKSPAIYWYYIVLVKSDIEGYYEIKEIVYGNSNITCEYDLVVMWHQDLKDEKQKSDLDNMYTEKGFYEGKLVAFVNIPSEKGNCDITMSVLGYSNNSSIMTQTLKEETKLPILVGKEDCKFLGWRSSVDNELYSTFPGYNQYENISYIKYTAVWELVKVAPTERIEYTHLEILDSYSILVSLVKSS